MLAAGRGPCMSREQLLGVQVEPPDLVCAPFCPKLMENSLRTGPRQWASARSYLEVAGTRHMRNTESLSICKFNIQGPTSSGAEWGGEVRESGLGPWADCVQQYWQSHRLIHFLLKIRRISAAMGHSPHEVTYEEKPSRSVKPNLFIHQGQHRQGNR